MKMMLLKSAKKMKLNGRTLVKMSYITLMISLSRMGRIVINEKMETADEWAWNNGP